MTSALSQVGPGQGHRLVAGHAVDHLTQRQDRRVHILGHHVRVAAVQPVVEVVPHPAVPHRAADHTRQQRHAVGGQEPARLGEQRELVAPVAEHLVDDACDGADRRHRLAVGHGKPAADVDDPSRRAERIADVGDEVQGAAQCFSPRLDGRSLAADVKAEAGEADSGGQYVLDDQFRVSGMNAELRRQIRFRRRITEREPHQDVDVRRAGP